MRGFKDDFYAWKDSLSKDEQALLLKQAQNEFDKKFRKSDEFSQDLPEEKIQSFAKVLKKFFDNAARPAWSSLRSCLYKSPETSPCSDMRALFLFFETVWAKEKDDYKKAPGKVGRLLYRVCPSVSIVYCGRPKRRVQLSKSSVLKSPN